MQDVLNELPIAHVNNKKYPRVLICILKIQEDGEASEGNIANAEAANAEEDQGKRSAHSPLFEFNDPADVEFESPLVPSCDGISWIFRNDDADDDSNDIFVKQEPVEEDIDDLEDIGDIIKGLGKNELNVAHASEQKKDKAKDCSMPPSAVHKRTFSVALKEPAAENDNSGVNDKEQPAQKKTETAKEIQKKTRQKKKSLQREESNDAPFTRTRSKGQK